MEIEVVRKVLDANDLIATENRREFDDAGCFVVNMMGSPGSGKTSVLERTLSALGGEFRTGILEGDIRGSFDADRLRRFGLPIAQINTDPLFGGECHLDARMVRNALASLPLGKLDLLIIENVGNLVCPAEFWVGEDRKVMVASVTEGEEKPLKYPLMYRQSAVLLLNKLDLMPHVGFDLAGFRENVAQVNPTLPVIELSARTGEGIDGWVEWLKREANARAASRKERSVPHAAQRVGGGGKANGQGAGG